MKYRVIVRLGSPREWSREQVERASRLVGVSLVSTTRGVYQFVTQQPSLAVSRIEVSGLLNPGDEVTMRVLRSGVVYTAVAERACELLAAYLSGEFTMCSPEEAHSEHGLCATQHQLCWEGAYVEDDSIVFLGDDYCAYSVSVKTGAVQPL